MPRRDRFCRCGARPANMRLGISVFAGIRGFAASPGPGTISELRAARRRTRPRARRRLQRGPRPLPADANARASHRRRPADRVHGRCGGAEAGLRPHERDRRAGRQGCGGAAVVAERVGHPDSRVAFSGHAIEDREGDRGGHDAGEQTRQASRGTAGARASGDGEVLCLGRRGDPGAGEAALLEIPHVGTGHSRCGHAV